MRKQESKETSAKRREGSQIGIASVNAERKIIQIGIRKGLITDEEWDNLCGKVWDTLYSLTNIDLDDHIEAFVELDGGKESIDGNTVYFNIVPLRDEDD